MGKKQLAIRLGQMVLVLIGISFITFCLVMLAPGDPVRQMIAGNEDIVVSQVEIDDHLFSSIWTGWAVCFMAISVSLS